MPTLDLPVPLNLWCLGLLILTNFMAAWFFSNFPQHLWNKLHPKQSPVFTKDDLMLAAVDRYGAFGDLWICPLCLGTWFSFGVSTILALSTGLALTPALVFVLAAASTWPVCFYLIYGVLKRI